MFIHIKSDHEIELIATGSVEIQLLERLSKGIHVQAYDKGRSYVSFLTVVPELLPEEKAIGGKHEEEIRAETLKQVFDLLLAHKEFQRRWKGGIQVLFGFSPDELDIIKEGSIPQM